MTLGSITWGASALAAEEPAGGPFDLRFETLVDGIHLAYRPDVPRYPVIGNAVILETGDGVVLVDGGGAAAYLGAFPAARIISHPWTHERIESRLFSQASGAVAHGLVQRDRGYADKVLALQRHAVAEIRRLRDAGLDEAAIRERLDLSPFDEAITAGDPRVAYFFDRWYRQPIVGRVLREMPGSRP